MQSYQYILLNQQDQTAIITINRSSKMNALNQQVLEELAHCFEVLKTNDTIRGIILKGSGEKAFVAGADIQEFVGKTVDEATSMSRLGHEKVMNVIATFPKPVLAAINGYALGGGLELAMACHLRIAASHAQMGLPEVSLGIIPGYGGTQRLPELVGRGKALEMILTGDMLSAEEALQWGLVNYVVSSDMLFEKCQDLLNRMYLRSATAIATAIHTVDTGIRDSASGYDQEIVSFGNLFASPEAKEGVDAFLNKRKPKF